MDENEKQFDMVTDEQGRIFALFIRQPFAQMFANGQKHIEIRKENTDIRGDILLCSTKGHDYKDAQSGCSVGIVDLYDVKQVSELDSKEWEQTRIPKHRRKQIKKGFAWMFRNERRIIEFPVLQLKKKHGFIIFNIDDIFIYPKYVIYDKPAKEKELNEFLKRHDYD